MARAAAGIAAAAALVVAPGGAALALQGTFRIDVETGVQLTPAGDVGFGSLYSSARNEVLSQPGRQALVATSVATQTSRVIARPPQWITTMRWSPDGSAIAFSLNATPAAGCPETQRRPCGHGEIWLVQSDGSGLHKFSDDAVKPAWSPDSGRLAFLGNFDMPAQTGVVMVANVNGTGRRALSGRGAGSGPEWSGDGRFIAYTRTDLRGYHERVRTVQVAGGKSTQQTVGASRFLSWSPVGSQLAYVHYLPAGTRLYVTDPAAGMSRTLVASPRLSHAAWSPDGRLLAYYENPGRCGVGPKIVVVRAAGGVERRLQLRPPSSTASMTIFELAWDADGSSILGSTAIEGLSCVRRG